MIPVVATLVLALGPLGYVISGERVLHQLVGARAELAPMMVEAELEGEDGEEAGSVRFELDPDRGVRVRDAAEGRWLLVGGRIWARAGDEIPGWIPPLELLVVRDEERLTGWLLDLGIDLSTNQLARCGEGDCFVLGGASEPEQLWIDKDRFEVRRRRSARGRVADFDGYRDWNGIRFPDRIRLGDPLGPLATLRITRVAVAPSLAREDFSPAWLE